MSFGIIASSHTGVAGGLGDGTAFANAVLAQNPLMYWRLNETSGTTANDLSGHSRTGTYSGSPTLDAVGMIQGYNSRSTYFSNLSALDDYVTAPVAAWMDTPVLTLTCVIMSSVSGLRMIASRYHDPNSDRSWFLYNENNRFKFYVRDRYTPASETIVDAGFNFEQGRAYFIAAYASPAATGLRVYDETGLVGSATGAGHDVYHSTRNLRLACDDTLSYYDEAYISDFAYFDHIVPTGALDAMATVALARKPRWLHSVKGTSPRNGTTDHTITYPPTTAGSLQVAFLYGSDNVPLTMQTVGWTQRLVQPSSTDGALYIYTRSVNAGETSCTISYATAGFPLNYAIYELPPGSSYHSLASISHAQAGLLPTLSSLPGTPVLVFGIVSAVETNAGNSVTSSIFRYGWLGEMDNFIAHDGVTNGSYLAVGYQDYLSTTSATPNVQVYNTMANSHEEATIAFVVP